MKLFSIINKPANKAGNKQAGIVFLEYVIMAFIATVAVICAIWWLYWHLQQMTWEIKQKLETMSTSLTCPLGKPWGTQEEQPIPGGGEQIGPISFQDTQHTGHFVGGTTYANQTITITNSSVFPPSADSITLMLLDGNGSPLLPVPPFTVILGVGNQSFNVIQSATGPSGKYEVHIGGFPTDGFSWPINYDVTITQTP
jgi:hypothetical protein